MLTGDRSTMENIPGQVVGIGAITLREVVDGLVITRIRPPRVTRCSGNRFEGGRVARDGRESPARPEGFDTDGAGASADRLDNASGRSGNGSGSLGMCFQPSGTGSI